MTAVTTARLSIARRCWCASLALLWSGCSCGGQILATDAATTSSDGVARDDAEVDAGPAPFCCAGALSDCSTLEGGVNSPFRCKADEICGYSGSNDHCCHLVPPKGVPGCFCGEIYNASPCPN